MSQSKPLASSVVVQLLAVVSDAARAIHEVAQFIRALGDPEMATRR